MADKTIYQPGELVAYVRRGTYLIHVTKDDGGPLVFGGIRFNGQDLIRGFFRERIRPTTEAEKAAAHSKPPKCLEL